MLKSKLKTDVLIVGAGSVGLTLSALLSRLQVNHLIVEKKSAISRYRVSSYTKSAFFITTQHGNSL